MVATTNFLWTSMPQQTKCLTDNIDNTSLCRSRHWLAVEQRKTYGIALTIIRFRVQGITHLCLKRQPTHVKMWTLFRKAEESILLPPPCSVEKYGKFPKAWHKEPYRKGILVQGQRQSTGLAWEVQYQIDPKPRIFRGSARLKKREKWQHQDNIYEVESERGSDRRNGR